MSIAINTRSRTSAPARRIVRAIPVERAEMSRAEQLREGRRLMRHFVLAFVAAGTGLYTMVAAGVTF